MEDIVKIVSIFKSVNGEVNLWGQGTWATFVRFHGCVARCGYCDTKYSWETGTPFQNIAVVDLVKLIEQKSCGCKRIMITGGEPFEQPNVLKVLIKQLLIKRYIILVETNGLHCLCSYRNDHFKKIVGVKHHIWDSLSFVMDCKLQYIKRGQIMAWEHSSDSSTIDIIHATFNNLLLLSAVDNVKIVISDYEDFEKAMLLICIYLQKKKHDRPTIFLSPCFGKVTSQKLITWMQNHSKCSLWDIGINFPIHKHIFPGDWRNEEN